MAPEELARSQEGESNILAGPWRGPIYKDPAHADFYLPRVSTHGGDILSVYATVKGTVHIWEVYKSGAKHKEWPFAIMTFEGDPCGTGIHRDPQEAARQAMLEKAFVYNFKTRKAWRPVWFPSTPTNLRDMGNMAHETVNLYGWKSFIEGWGQRPRARLFDND